MPYPQTFTRLVASGQLYGTETFSFGLSIVPDFDNGPAPDTEALVEAVADATATFFTAARISTAAYLTLLKFNNIGPDGRYASDSETTQWEYDPAVRGTIGASPAPQIALAVSLMTAAARGRAHAGRFYLPVPSQAPETTGLISTADAQTVGTAATAWLRALNDLMPEGRVVGVASDVGAGTFRPVTHVRVGRVLDTIRSRRRALAENYVEMPPLDGP